jgi:hypothetical protein
MLREDALKSIEKTLQFQRESGDREGGKKGMLRKGAMFQD